MDYHWYCDGACSGNPGAGGFGVVCLNPLSYFYRESHENTTNNREELNAILHVLKYIAENHLENETHYIYSDSAYAIGICSNWIYSWERNGWTRSRNQPIENLELIKSIYIYLNKNFMFCKVKGHNGLLENEIADALAAGNREKLQKLLLNNHILKEE